METSDTTSATETTSATDTTPERRYARWGVPILGFATFAVGTDEFVLAGVLAELSHDLHIALGTAGQVVTVFALTCAVLAPVLATATASRPKRAVLLFALTLHLAGALATALAPGFVSVLAAQMIAAAGAGLFVPTAAVTAAALVPDGRQGRAIAIVTTGLTAATALGAPIGTAIGGALGWRATMWFVVGLTALAFVAVRCALPARVPSPVVEGLRARLRPLRDGRVVAVLATTLIGFTAIYLPYTYIAAVFEPATAGNEDRLALLIATVGVIGTLGNLAAGALADRLGGRRVVTGALLWLTASLAVMPLLTGSFMAGLAAVVLYGVAAFAVTTPQQQRLVMLDQASAAVLVSLNAASLYLAISLSGVVGAVALDWTGAASLPLVAAALAAVALLLSEVAHRLSRRGPDTDKPGGGTAQNRR